MQAVEVELGRVVDGDDVDEERGGGGHGAVRVGDGEGDASRRGVRALASVAVGDVTQGFADGVGGRGGDGVEKFFAARERRGDVQLPDVGPDRHGDAPGPRRRVRRRRGDDGEVDARSARLPRDVADGVRERRAVSFVPSGVVVVDAEVFDGRVRGVGDLHQRARQRGAALDAREERVGRQTNRSVALGEGRAQRRAGRARGGIEDNLGGSRAAREGYRAREDREHRSESEHPEETGGNVVAASTPPPHAAGPLTPPPARRRDGLVVLVFEMSRSQQRQREGKKRRAKRHNRGEGVTRYEYTLVAR